MRIYVTNVFVDDQDKAEKFYTDVLGFKVKNSIPLGGSSLTRKSVSPMRDRGFGRNQAVTLM